MCTLTLFRRPNGFNIFMNRDERHDRIAELPPRIIHEQNNVFGPVDPASGGTWIAHNDKGFWGCLLNGYFQERVDPDKLYTSRGEILPNILAQDDPLAAAQLLDPSKYMSFRLLIGSPEQYQLYEWDEKNYRSIDFHASYDDRIFLLSSSSWKQSKVIQERKALFEEWASENESNGDTIPSFHYSTHPSPEAAPMMMRSYSGTKSITNLHVNSKETTMEYRAVQKDKAQIDKKELEHKYG